MLSLKKDIFPYWSSLYLFVGEKQIRLCFPGVLRISIFQFYFLSFFFCTTNDNCCSGLFPSTTSDIKHVHKLTSVTHKLC